MNTDNINIEQFIFGSFPHQIRVGYEVVAISEGITRSDKSSLWSLLFHESIGSKDLNNSSSDEFILCIPLPNTDFQIIAKYNFSGTDKAGREHATRCHGVLVNSDDFLKISDVDIILRQLSLKNIDTRAEEGVLSSLLIENRNNDSLLKSQLKSNEVAKNYVLNLLSNKKVIVPFELVQDVKLIQLIHFALVKLEVKNISYCTYSSLKSEKIPNLLMLGSSKEKIDLIDSSLIEPSILLKLNSFLTPPIIIEEKKVEQVTTEENKAVIVDFDISPNRKKRNLTEELFFFKQFFKRLFTRKRNG